MGSEVSKEYYQKQNEKLLSQLIRGDLIKATNEAKETIYYVYGGDRSRLYVIKNGKDFFAYPKEDVGVETVSYTDIYGEYMCSIIPASQWIKETEDSAITNEDYNIKILQVLLPGDVVQINSHHCLYIGNSQVIHLIHSDNTSYEYRKRRKAEFEALPRTGAIVTHDIFLDLTKNGRAQKNNLKGLNGLPVKTILERAESQCGPASYNWLSQNSKHFAYEMKYGKQYYSKVRSFAIGKSTDSLHEEIKRNEEDNEEEFQTLEDT